MSTDHKPFFVRFALEAPILIGGRLTLDAILASELVREEADLSAAECLPLAETEGVWQASAALLETPAPSVGAAVIAAFRPEREIPDPRRLKPQPGVRQNGGIPSVDQTDGPYRNRMSTYRAYETAAVWFAGVGDVDAVRSLVSSLPGIGAKWTVGWGQVAKVELGRLAERPNAGIAGTDGTPLRPVPASVWGRISNRPATIASERFRAPYWRTPLVPCAVPDAAPIMLDRKAIRALIGL